VLWWNTRAERPIRSRNDCWCLGDGGGSNSATQYLFKEDLQGLAIGWAGGAYGALSAVLFQHIRSNTACSRTSLAPVRGHLPHVDIARQFIERTKTTSGLRVTVRILDKVYKRAQIRRVSNTT